MAFKLAGAMSIQGKAAERGKGCGSYLDVLVGKYPGVVRLQGRRGLGGTPSRERQQREGRGVAAGRMSWWQEPVRGTFECLNDEGQGTDTGLFVWAGSGIETRAS